MYDEVYVKKMRTYHGGTVYGSAANNPSVFADTVLGVMVNCLHGGPKFLTKMIPVSNLDTNFLKQQVETNIDAVKLAGGEILVTVSDGNRTNQSLFKRSETVEDKPWLRVDGVYQLYDFVHLLKTLRNLWLTEKTGQLEFVWDGDSHVAYWKHLQDLQRTPWP